MNGSKFLAGILLALLSGIVSGCDKGAGLVGSPVFGGRHAITSVYPQTPIASFQGALLGPENTVIGANVSYTTAIPGKGSGNPVTLVQLDWGDSGAYDDVTADALSKWWRGGTGPSDPDFLSLHTYSSPGEYTIRARVTYWDGIVVEDDPDFRTQIKIGRWVIGYTYGITPLDFEDHWGIGPPGTEVGARLTFPLNIPDRPGDTAEKVISKAEIDWGDGSGYHDVTQDALGKWGRGSTAEDPTYLSHHVYADPGEYTISGRVTYWDGVLVVDEEVARSKLRITP